MAHQGILDEQGTVSVPQPGPPLQSRRDLYLAMFHDVPFDFGPPLISDRTLGQLRAFSRGDLPIEGDIQAALVQPFLVNELRFRCICSEAATTARFNQLSAESVAQHLASGDHVKYMRRRAIMIAENLPATVAKTVDENRQLLLNLRAALPEAADAMEENAA